MSENEAGQLCPQPCVHLSQDDAREGRTCLTHPCTCSREARPSVDALIAGAVMPLPELEDDPTWKLIQAALAEDRGEE